MKPDKYIVIQPDPDDLHYIVAVWSEDDMTYYQASEEVYNSFDDAAIMLDVYEELGVLWNEQTRRTQ